MTFFYLKGDNCESNFKAIFAQSWCKDLVRPLKRTVAKHDLLCATVTCGGALCESKFRCACGTHFGSNFQCACVQCILRLAKCNRNIAHHFGNIKTNDETQKWRILAIFQTKSIFEGKNSKIGASIYIKVTVASCNQQKSKLRAVADGFQVTELQVRQVKIGSKSCFAR